MPEHAPFPEQRPRPIKAVQRCPNCEARTDVSFYVAGVRVRCSRCGVRFEVERQPAAPVVEVHRRAPVPAPAPVTPPQAASSLELAIEAALAQAQPEADLAAVPVAQDGQQAVRAPSPSATQGLPHLEGFVVHERLGQGGMGEVYRCTRLADGRALAVKVLSASLAAVPDYVRRFDREAAAMAQLSHPGIVKLLDRGRSGPHCWISMELIDGISLRTFAARQKPSPQKLARLFAQVAHALAYAHARAVVHRDLKPDNVLVLSDLRTKVLDFGLAGLHAEGAEVLTQSNVAMGTANYMAPEQRKDARRADHRADLYSFGVMAYELLTGELPVGKFAAPSRLVPGLDHGWDVLVERCLEPDPSARPHSALELAHALEALGGMNEPLALAPRTRRREPRRLWSWIGLGAGAAVVLGTAALQVARDHEKRAAAELRAAQPQARVHGARPARARR
jgi:serine/threonine-protein kinase